MFLGKYICLDRNCLPPEERMLWPVHHPPLPPCAYPKLPLTAPAGQSFTIACPNTPVPPVIIADLPDNAEELI